MKKLALASVVLVLLVFGLSVSATPAPTVDAVAQETDAIPAETSAEGVEVEAVETAEPGLCLAQTAMFPGPNHCGDPCTEEGETAGCIDTSGPFWKRVICTCVNGSLVC